MLRLDLESFRRALVDGSLTVPHLLDPFIAVDRTRYNDLRRKAEGVSVSSLADRYGPQTRLLRTGLSQTWRCAMTYFPAYRFHCMEFLRDEWLATVQPDAYHRDHVLHQVLTYYTASVLLNGGHNRENSRVLLAFGGKTLLDHVLDAVLSGPHCRYLHDMARSMGVPSAYLPARQSPATRKLWEVLIREVLCLASMFHDIGYPWQFIGKVENALRERHPESVKISDATYEALAGRLVTYPFRSYRSAVEPGTPHAWSEKVAEAFSAARTERHGVAGAIAFLHLNDILREYPGDRDHPVRRFCLEWAAMVILTHDCAGVYRKGGHRQMRLSFEKAPLSFVLALADQIQDFSRPTARFVRKPTSSLDSGLKYDFACSSIALGVNDGTLDVEFRYPSAHDYVKNREFKKRDEQECFNPVDGYLDYGWPQLGLKAVKFRVRHGK